jgi:acetyltransferase-like isoleucine patch superfamily enzyme
MDSFVNKIIVKFVDKLRNEYAKIYLSYLREQFRQCGKSLVIEQPMSIHMPSKITIGENFVARSNFKLRAFDKFNEHEYDPDIVIGDDVYVATDCHIAAIGKITIGNNVSLASFVTIIDHMHGRSDYGDIDVPVMRRCLTTKGPITIEDNVWIGEHSVVLSGVNIGKNSIIGANSVVTASIPENCIAAGAPARIIRRIE